MSNARTVRERAIAAAIETLATYTDGFRQENQEAATRNGADKIEREFADLVETDARVRALVEAATRMVQGALSEYGKHPCGSCKANAEALCAALKPFGK